MGNVDRKEWRRMIDIQVPMMRWTRSRGLIALLEEIRALEKRSGGVDLIRQEDRPDAPK